MFEVGADDYDRDGFPIIRRALLVDVATYATRFSELLARGYAWLNLSFYGLLDARPLVVVEVPRRTSDGVKTTSVNYSGPSQCVVDAGGDARVAICLR